MGEDSCVYDDLPDMATRTDDLQQLNSLFNNAFKHFKENLAKI